MASGSCTAGRGRIRGAGAGCREQEEEAAAIAGVQFGRRASGSREESDAAITKYYEKRD